MWGMQVDNMEQMKVFLFGIHVAMERAKTELPKAYARHVCRQIKNNVYQQRFNFQPLTKRYLRWKLANGRDRRIFISTGKYVRSIQVRKSGDSWHVVIPEGLMDGGISMAKLAAVLEFGSPARNIAPRPLWAMTQAQMIRDYPRYAKEFARVLLSGIAGFNVGKGQGGTNMMQVSFTSRG